MTDPRICIAILAGGAGQRLGGQKPSRIIGGRPLIAHVLDRLQPQGLVVLSGDAELAQTYALAAIADATPERHGPLAGLLAVLRWARHHDFTGVVTAPCDTPFLPPDLVTALCHAAPRPALARSSGQLHHTIGYWPVTLVAALEEMHEQQGLRRMGDFIRTLDFIAVDWPDQPLDPFFNVNMPFDLAQAAHMLRSGAAPAVLDAKGLKCPLPALKIGKMLARLASGAAVLAECTDPMAAIDVPHLVFQRGDTLLASQTDGKVLRFLIEIK